MLGAAHEISGCPARSRSPEARRGARVADRGNGGEAVHTGRRGERGLNTLQVGAPTGGGVRDRALAADRRLTRSKQAPHEREDLSFRERKEHYRTRAAGAARARPKDDPGRARGRPWLASQGAMPHEPVDFRVKTEHIA